MRITTNTYRPVVAVAMPTGQKRVDIPSAPKAPENYLEARRIESEVKAKWRAQQARKAACGMAGFGLGVLAAKELGVVGIAGALAAHIAALKTAEHLLIKDVTTEEKE